MGFEDYINLLHEKYNALLAKGDDMFMCGNYVFPLEKKPRHVDSCGMISLFYKDIERLVDMRLGDYSLTREDQITAWTMFPLDVHEYKYNPSMTKRPLTVLDLEKLIEGKPVLHGTDDYSDN